MTGRRRIARAFTVAFAAGAAMLMSASAGLADPHDDQARVEQEMAQTRALMETASAEVSAAAERLAEANARLPELQQTLADARGILAGAKARQVSAARALEQANADLAAAGIVVTETNQAVDATRDEIGRFAASSFMGRDVAGISAMLSVEDPAGFVSSLTYLDYIGAAQKRTLDDHTRARTEARNAENTQAGLQRTASDKVAEADEAVRLAAAAEEEAARAEAELAAMVRQRTDALAVAEQNRASQEARYAELQAESERIAEEIRALANQGGPVIGSSRLPMPVNGWKSSDFGTRFDPFYQVWQLHAGVDLAAPGGSPIWAVAGGTVMRAGWNGGYGNYTCIYHGLYQGQGFATCYAHQSNIYVWAGQEVYQGQVIGAVGTTGASTGNHLHFEVRLDGTPVDPVPWLPPCLC